MWHLLSASTLPHGYVPLPVSEILFFCTKLKCRIPWISCYYFDFLLWQIFLDYSFYVNSLWYQFLLWWAVSKFTGQGCAVESWLYTSIFLSIPLKSPLQKLKIKFILLEFSQQTLVRNVVASDLLRGLFFFWKRCDGEFWAWWLCENDDFSVTVDWKKKSKIIPSRTSTNGQLSKMAIFFLWTVHTFTLVSTCPLYNGHFLLFPREKEEWEEFQLYWLPTGVKPMTFWFTVTRPDALPLLKPQQTHGI